jgi:DNA repair exonuclease SbcCD ATPase subunit
MLTQVSHSQTMTLLLNGYSITEVADMLEVSRTTVYNRRKDFLDYAKKEGVFMAAEHFDVEETFDELFNLARELKQNDLRVEEARRGSKIVVLLDSINVKEPESFIRDVIQKSQESDISGEEITRYAIELRQLEREEGKTYSQLVSEIKEKKGEYKEVEKNLRLLEEQREQVENDLERKLEESEITREKLASFVKTRDSLIEEGINIEDFEQLAKLIINFKEHDFELDEIIEFYGEMELSRENLERNRAENKRLEDHNKSLLRENYSQEEKLEENLALVTSVKLLREAEIEPDVVIEIIETISDMADVMDLSREEAIDRFIMDIKTKYNERTNFEFQLEELKKLQQAYQEKNNLIKEQVEVLEEVLEDRKLAIDSLKRIETVGISDDELVEWGNLIKDLDYDLSIFRDAIATLGGIPAYVENKTQKISLLEAKENELKASVESLEKKLEAIQQTLVLVQKTVESETNKIKDTVEEFEEYFTSNETGFKIRSRRIFDDIVENMITLLNNTKSEWNSDLEILDENVKKIVDETDRILENAYTGGRIVGRFHALEPIHKILREEEVPLTEGTIGVITMLTYIKIWLARNYSDEQAKVFDSVIERLMGDLGDIYQR